MLRHVSLLTFRPGTTDGQVDTILDALSALPTTIDAIIELRCGRDLGFADDNADIAVVVDLADRAAWDDYQRHPTHQAVLVDLIRPLLERRTAAQFTV